jgi:hypothetical protein
MEMVKHYMGCDPFYTLPKWRYNYIYSKVIFTTNETPIKRPQELVSNYLAIRHMKHSQLSFAA